MITLLILSFSITLALVSAKPSPFNRSDLLPGPAVHLVGKGKKENATAVFLPETIRAINAAGLLAMADPEKPLFQNAWRHALSRRLSELIGSSDNKRQ